MILAKKYFKMFLKIVVHLYILIVLNINYEEAPLFQDLFIELQLLCKSKYYDYCCIEFPLCEMFLN